MTDTGAKKDDEKDSKKRAKREITLEELERVRGGVSDVNREALEDLNSELGRND